MFINQTESAPGVFITLEGGEGTGKSTQVKLLAQHLKAQGVEVITTREPGGTPEAEKIRDLLVQRDGGDWDVMSEALLLFAARREHLKKVILPAIKRGAWVISDRFVDSSYVFQGYGMGMNLSVIEDLYKLVANDFEPDLTFVFDLPPEIGLERSNKQLQMTDIVSESTEDRYERMGLGFHTKLRQGFLDIAEKHKHRCVIVDAMQDIETVQTHLTTEINRRFLDAHDHLGASIGGGNGN